MATTICGKKNNLAKDWWKEPKRCADRWVQAQSVLAGLFSPTWMVHHTNHQLTQLARVRTLCSMIFLSRTGNQVALSDWDIVWEKKRITGAHGGVRPFFVSFIRPLRKKTTKMLWETCRGGKWKRPWSGPPDLFGGRLLPHTHSHQSLLVLWEIERAVTVGFLDSIVSSVLSNHFSHSQRGPFRSIGILCFCSVLAR